MARDRSRHRTDGRRPWPVAPEPPDDAIGRLDDVLATLEEMLDERGIAAAERARGAGAPRGRGPAAEPRDPGDLGDRGGLPLLRDVVAPALDGEGDGAVPGSGADGAPEGAGPKGRGPELKLEHEPLPLGFDIIDEEPIPRIGRLDFDAADIDFGADPVVDPAADPIAGPADGPMARPAGGPVASPPAGPPARPRAGPTLPPPSEPGADSRGERYGGAAPPSLDPEVYRHLIDRLANEIDVIVQTGTEEAMRRAATDIAARVREHVAIILPEVIEELVDMANRRDD